MLLIQNEVINVSNASNLETKKLLELSERKSLKYYNSLYTGFFSQLYIRSNSKINHFFDIEFGDSINEVKRKLQVVYSSIPIGGFLDVLCYKIKIGEHKIEVELHFYQNDLVFFKYAFPFIKNRGEIIHYLNQKYFKNVSHFGFISEGIMDPYDNCLRVCDKEVFTVMYLCRKSSFLAYLNE
ncbi:hypothetical protein SAMN04489761_1436 [Tenacibaculum sp. MAR_2009_124]|uniref:hypothetical protein n=1 Tax=Tenacibaculum sp. MAR_2009_124 TaxID=1250059 RepID=UPI000898B333|nr:hypothetical protein [Tenacibaculum sp. MAR_2009_124]SEB68365.1 hypothetical protein SAMN04489761_1436 [Tenacibaculum sp. MAR_2009_124]